ncbi:hypothetical protein WC7_00809 [Citrobacter sp. KTE151]|nr:hypothetical protein WC7_00809 [Citrobacter sp. KTE151]
MREPQLHRLVQSVLNHLYLAVELKFTYLILTQLG